MGEAWGWQLCYCGIPPSRARIDDHDHAPPGAAGRGPKPCSVGAIESETIPKRELPSRKGLKVCWDVRQSHEAQAGLAPDALPAMCSCLPEMQWQFLAHRHAGGLDGIHVICAGEASWAFRVHDETVTSLAEAPTEFDTCARADAESLILLTMGRAEAEDTLQSGVLAIEGDVEKGQRLCDTLSRTF